MVETTIDPMEAHLPRPVGDDGANSVADPINQALEIIDRSLGTLHQRELVSASEMSDILLDMRSLLASDPAGLEQLEDAVR